MRLPCVSRNKDMHIVASLVLFDLDHHLIDGKLFLASIAAHSQVILRNHYSYLGLHGNRFRNLLSPDGCLDAILYLRKFASFLITFANLLKIIHRLSQKYHFSGWQSSSVFNE